MADLKNKIALITGGARGQGASEARLFIKHGAKVVIADVADTDGEGLAAELGENAVYRRLDVSLESDWNAAVDFAQHHFGGLHILINNAGVLGYGSIEGTSLEDYRRIIDINQIGCWLGMKAVVPALRGSGGGAIVNISSAGGMVGIAYASAYVASKFAVRGMTKVAALEFGVDNIRVNSVHPGAIDTAMVPGDSDDSSAGYKQFPISRIGRPDEVAEMVLFLASEKSSYITGSEFVIDGGMLAGFKYDG